MVASQLKLQLGLPVEVGHVSTQDPEWSLLSNVRLTHPEYGILASADQIRIKQPLSLGAKPLWAINHLRVRESALAELGQALHESFLRQNSLSTLPEITIKSLDVIKGNFASAEFPSNVDSPLALALSNVYLTGQGVSESAAEGSRESASLQIDAPNGLGQATGVSDQAGISMMALLQSPNRITSLMSLPEATGVPISLWLNRLKPTSSSPTTLGSGGYSTAWELATCNNQPINSSWIQLDGFPDVFRQSHGIRLTGTAAGEFSGGRWRFNIHDANWEGGDLADLSQLISADANRLQGPLIRLHITHSMVECQLGKPPEIVRLQAELQAVQGSVRKELMEGLRRLVPDYSAAEVLHDRIGFKSLNLGIQIQEERLAFQHLEEVGRRLPVIQGMDSQELFDLSNDHGHPIPVYDIVAMVQRSQTPQQVGSLAGLISLLPQPEWPFVAGQGGVAGQLKQVSFQDPAPGNAATEVYQRVQAIVGENVPQAFKIGNTILGIPVDAPESPDLDWPSNWNGGISGDDHSAAPSLSPEQEAILQLQPVHQPGNPLRPVRGS